MAGSAENTFITSASVGGPRAGVLRDDIPQFAFAGRSNVGKSSLLNAIMRQRLARTSAAPGKTRQANVFQITVSGGLGHPGSWSAYLVDLPGYGYARGGPESVKDLKTVVESYFAATQARGVFLLVDSRHPGLASDVDAHAWLSAHVSPPHVVATKVDKLSRAERDRNLREFARVFGQPPLAVSSDSGEGLDHLRRVIANLVKGS